MVKRVIWSERANRDAKSIFSYWNKRNKSNIYSQKLRRLFKEAEDILATHSKIGRETDDEEARIKVVKEYLLFYDESPETITIVTVWDGRRNPEEFKL